jgi:hypothetical protein
MNDYPLPDTWEHATPKQIMRAKRSFAELRKRGVPVYQGPLLVPEEDQAVFQTPEDVAKRVLVLWAVELRAEAVPIVEVREIIDRFDLWVSVSPEELRFLNDANPTPEECQDLVWRLECLWVLMWALGHIDSLDWPSEMCDVDLLARLLSDREEDPRFISEAVLRSAEQIIDAQDLTMRIHWAIRDAMLHQGGSMPDDLDWTAELDYVPVHLSAAAGVVRERHFALNWLVNYLSPASWDEVDTPT